MIPMSIEIREAVASDAPEIERLVKQDNPYYSLRISGDGIYDFVIVDKETKKMCGFFQTRTVTLVETMYVDQGTANLKRGRVFVEACNFLSELFKMKKIFVIWMAKILDSKFLKKDVPLSEQGIYKIYGELGTRVNHRKFIIYKNF